MALRLAMRSLCAIVALHACLGLAARPSEKSVLRRGGGGAISGHTLSVATDDGSNQNGLQTFWGGVQNTFTRVVGWFFPSSDDDGQGERSTSDGQATATEDLPVKDLPVMMTDKEKQFLGSFLSRSHKYLEFGAGGSTEFATRHANIQRIHAIESQDEWIQKLTERENIADNIKSGRLNLVNAGIGPARSYGYPVGWPKDNSTRDLWPRYSGSSALDGEGEDTKFDLILIDGRFRVACFLSTLQRIKPEDIETTDLLMHDVNGNGHPDYESVVLEFADKVDQVGTLAHYRKKTHVDEKKMAKVLSEYQYRPEM